MKNTSAEHGQNIFHGNSMNNLLSYRELTDAKIRASDKDLPYDIFLKSRKQNILYCTHLNEKPIIELSIHSLDIVQI